MYHRGGSLLVWCSSILTPLFTTFETEGDIGMCRAGALVQAAEGEVFGEIDPADFWVQMCGNPAMYTQAIKDCSGLPLNYMSVISKSVKVYGKAYNFEPALHLSFTWC